MINFEDLVDHITRRPSMWTHPGNYGAVCAYLTGYDHATNGGALIGFREWLVVKFGEGDNLPWSSLVLFLVLPHGTDHSAVYAGDLELNERALTGLGRLLKEYFELRSKFGTTGVREIFAEYQHWLEGQSWYDEGHPNFIRGSGTQPRHGTDR